MRTLSSDRSAVTAACRELLTAGTVKVACLARAPAAGVYRVRLHDQRSVIVKLYFGAAQWKAVKERLVIEALDRIGTVHTAGVLGFGRLVARSDATALIMVDLGVRTLWRAVQDKDCSYLEGFRLVGQLLASFHEIDLGSLKTILPQGHGGRQEFDAVYVARQLSMLRASSFDALAPRVEPALRRLVRLSREPRTWIWCHGDLHPANVILADPGDGSPVPHVVDFESTMRCPPEYDLAKSIVTSSALDVSDRRALIAGYGGWRTLCDELLCAFVVFHATDGWLYAALMERRDQSLWWSRVEAVLTHYAPLF